MSTLVLPFRSDVDSYDFEVDLEGRSYTIDVRWSDRASLWFFSLFDATGALLASNRAIVLNSRIEGNGVDSRKPPGPFLAIDTGGSGIDPGHDDLGSRVLVVYIESTP